MFELKLPAHVDDVDLASGRFWSSPASEREGAFELLRRERPVSFHAASADANEGIPGDYWAVTRHAHVLEVSRDPKLWSSEPSVSIDDFAPPLAPFFRSMVNMDDPRHTRLRKIISRGFTPAALGRLQPAIERRAAQVIDDVIEKGECDFVTEIAAPLSMRILCDLLGIPESEVEFVQTQTVLLMGSDESALSPGAEPLEASVEAAKALGLLMNALAKERLRTPRDDLTSQLIHADLDGDAMSESELVSFFVLLVLAGTTTTRDSISHGMKALCDWPDERRRWAADFEGIAGTAVEEILRWATPVRHFRRTSTRAAEIGGQPIRAGEKVVLWYTSANRDTTVFDEPYRFDLTRTPNDHLAFGGTGVHYCLGASLAKSEIKALFRELLSRIPDLQIRGRPRMIRSIFENGMQHMPCSFTPAGAGFR